MSRGMLIVTKTFQCKGQEAGVAQTIAVEKVTLYDLQQRFRLL